MGWEPMVQSSKITTYKGDIFLLHACHIILIYPISNRSNLGNNMNSSYNESVKPEYLFTKNANIYKKNGIVKRL